MQRFTRIAAKQMERRRKSHVVCQARAACCHAIPLLPTPRTHSSHLRDLDVDGSGGGALEHHGVPLINCSPPDSVEENPVHGDKSLTQWVIIGLVAVFVLEDKQDGGGTGDLKIVKLVPDGAEVVLNDLGPPRLIAHSDDHIGV